MTEDSRKVIAAALDEFASGGDSAARMTRICQAAQDLVACLPVDQGTALKHITMGWSKAESADALGLTMADYGKVRCELFENINARSTTEAVRIGIYAGLD